MLGPAVYLFTHLPKFIDRSIYVQRALYPVGHLVETFTVLETHLMPLTSGSFELLEGWPKHGA